MASKEVEASVDGVLVTHPSSDEVRANLLSPSPAFEAYAASPQGHARLTLMAEVASNTYLKALLQEALLKAARQVEPEMLELSNTIPPEAAPALAPPRTPIQVISEEGLLAAYEAAITTPRKGKTAKPLIDKYDTEQAVELFFEDRSQFRSTIINSWAGYSRSKLDFYFEDLYELEDEMVAAEAMRQARKHFLAYLLRLDRITHAFTADELGPHDDWSDFFALEGAMPGVLVLMAQRSRISDEAWRVVSKRAETCLLDAMVVATAHPSIPEREAALHVLEAQVPYLMDRSSLFGLAQVAHALPKRVQDSLLPQVEAQIEESWTNAELNAWRSELSSWDFRRAGDNAPKVLDQAGKPKRWWSKR